MYGLGNITIEGNLVADPQLRFTSAGKAMISFTVVTSGRKKNDVSGEWEDTDTTFWRVTAFDQLAENAAESLFKGSRAIVVGRPRGRDWETKEGEKRRELEITADGVGLALTWAAATAHKIERTQGAPKEDPWATASTSDDAPF